MLLARGVRCLVVGRAARELFAGRAPRDLRLLCEADGDALLSLAGAVAGPPGGPIRVGRRALAPAPGPGTHPLVVELAAAGAPLEKALADATLSVTAFGLEPLSGEWVDTWDGRADLVAGRVGPAGGAARLAHPLIAVAAARLMAELDLAASEALGRAAAAAVAALPEALGARLRLELEALLLAEAPDRALAWLRETGLEQALAPRARPDAAQLLRRLPADRVLRWTGWLRGGQAGRVLARLRMPRDRSRAIERRLAFHPVDRMVAPRPGSLGKALRRLGGREAFEGLCVLREEELTLGDEPIAAPLARLAELRELADAMTAAEAPTLAWSGRDVMEALGEPAGPRIGQALAFLADRVLEDPSRNTPEALAGWLVRWRREAEG